MTSRNYNHIEMISAIKMKGHIIQLPLLLYLPLKQNPLINWPKSHINFTDLAKDINWKLQLGAYENYRLDTNTGKIQYRDYAITISIQKKSAYQYDPIMLKSNKLLVKTTQAVQTRLK